MFPKSSPGLVLNRRLRILGLLGALLISGGALAAADVSRQPPAVYAEKVAPLLTPVADVTVPRERAKDDTNSGITLLDERIHIVGPDGRRVVVWQLAYKAFTEAGAKSCAEDVFTYLRGDQKFHLVTAETIQPDGTVLPVRPNALLVQSPQRQADYALYDDQEEVKIIFPNVKEGSITRVIAVIEDTQVRMPGEYAHDFTWNSTWATVRMNYVVDLPAALSERLRIHRLGSDVPEPVRSEPEAGWVRLRWQKTEIAGVRYEVGRAPARQVGPAIQLSTIATWDDVGRWFGGLLKGRDQLSPELAKKVDAWTNDSKTREEIVRVLLAQVANNVRYTGLELGQAAYQPHDCNEVWENQYGDCKDKANLLAAFLRHKGIEARVALVNTRHLGLIDRRSPDYGAFTHAITAIADGKGGYEFCDPTIAFCAPGMIGPGSADRDVLVVSEAGGEWVRTPAQHAGSAAYAFDLELDAAGELSGWMTVTADGYYGAGQRESFRKRDAEETKRTLTDWVRGFFAGAEVMDAIKVNPEVETGADVVKAYFIVAARQDQSDGRRTLTFPHGGWMLPNLGTSAQRESTYFLRQDKVSVKMGVKLPEGLTVQVRPEPYQFETPTGRASASWEFSGRIARAELVAEITQPSLTAPEFGRYYQAVQSMEAWLGKAVVLAMEAGVKRAETKTAEAIDLPLMPTGEGQIALVEKRYPYEGNHGLRRAALERVLQYFANDKNTVFQAHVRLGFLDWAADKNEQALERVLPLLANYRAAVSIHDYAWAENLQALALRDLKRTKEALPILTRILRDTTMTPFRRTNVLLSAADILEGDGDEAGAIELLAGGLELDPDKRIATYQRLVRLLLAKGEAERLKTVLAGLVEKHPGESTDVLAGVVKSAAGWSGKDAVARQRVLEKVVAEVVSSPGEKLQEAIKELGANWRTVEVATELQAELKRRLAAEPLASWYRPSQDSTLKAWDDFETAIKKAEGNSDAQLGTKLAVEALMSLPLDADFPAHLQRAMGQAEWWSRQNEGAPPPILLTLLDLGEKLPGTEHAYYEARFWRASTLARQGDTAGAREVYQKLVGQVDLPEAFVSAAHHRLGMNYEAAGEYEAALAVYLKIEPRAKESATAAGALLRAVFIQLHLKKAAEALRVIEVLGAVPEETLKNATGEKQIREFVALAKAGVAEKFWEARKKWWPAWTALVASVKLPVDDAGEVVPVIDDLVALGRELGKAQRAKDTREYFLVLNRAVSASRWLPAYAPEVAGLRSLTAKVLPAKDAALYALVISMLEIPVPVGVTGEAERQVQLAANLVDSRKAERALKVVTAFRATKRPEDESSRAMLRIWGFASLAARDQREACVEALEKQLADPEMPHRRAMSVGLLASLYGSLGRGEDQEKLLRRELANGHVMTDEEGKKELESKLAQLGGSRRFAGQVGEWIKSAGLNWYDFVEPQSLADPRLRDLEEVLKNPHARFGSAEVVKLQLLLAQDGNRGLDAQQTGWGAALYALAMDCPTRQEMARLIDTFVAREDVPEDLRAYLLWVGLCDVSTEKWTEEFARWEKHPLTARFNERQKQMMPLLARSVAVDMTDVEEITEVMEETSRAEIGSSERALINELSEALLGMGEIEPVRRLAEKIPGWRFAGSLNTSAERMQLEFARRIRAAEQGAEIHAALIKRTIEKFPQLPEQLPASYAGLRRSLLAKTPWYADKDMHAACLYLVKTRQFDRSDLDFWKAFLKSLHETEGGQEFAFELGRIALDTAKDDTERAWAVELLQNSVDMDMADVRERVQAMLAPYRDDIDAPMTKAEIRLQEIHVAIRIGQAVDLETCFNGIEHPLKSYIQVRTTLTHHLQTGNDVALRRYLAATDSSLLINLGLADLAMRAFDRLGMKTEAKLAREVCRREIKRVIGASWMSMSARQIFMIERLAEALNEPDVLPAKWIADVRERMSDPRARHQVLMLDVWLRRDWKAVVKEADVLIALNPSRFDLYWSRGFALSELGKKAEAIRDLTTFVTYSKNQLEYPKALELLAKLKE